MIEASLMLIQQLQATLSFLNLKAFHFFFLLEQEIKGFGSYVRKFPESWYG